MTAAMIHLAYIALAVSSAFLLMELVPNLEQLERFGNWILDLIEMVVVRDEH